ncbi:MAG TPA: ABC transporter permease [Candidatus Eisenbacteria bacterium]|nr:ABC transporter permease [Candidatus Eisenbacteria bacterium]
MRSLTLESVTKALPRVALPKLHLKAVVGGAIVVAFIAIGVAGPGLTTQHPNKQDLASMLRPPQGLAAPHVLGTDNLGRDILSRVIHGARVSLLVAFAVVFVSGFIGVSLGAISGYFGGKIDFCIQKLVEVVWAFPPLLLGITIMAFLGQGLFNLILALVAQRWIPYCRVVRGQTLSLRSRDFVTAAQCLGAGKARIIGRHIVPNVIQTSIVIGTFAMASAIIAEASLSFLGVGVPPEIPTWGTMLADARIYISTAWWLPLFPGLCIFITVLGINLLGDALRDALDPRLKRAGAGI